MVKYAVVVAMDGLDGWDDIVADEQGECEGCGHGGAVFAACPTSTMSEVVNALVALAVIVFIFRWATSGRSCPPPRCSSSSEPSAAPAPSSDSRSATAALGFRPKHVTQDMVLSIHPRPTHPLTTPVQVDQIHTMFPDIPSYVSPHPHPHPPAPAPHLPHLIQRQHPLRPLAHRQRRAHIEQDSRARVSRAGMSPPLHLFFFGVVSLPPPD